MRLEDMTYRPCVGTMVFNSAGLVFVGRRKGFSPEHVDAQHAWQMPQGGIDKGEDPYDAAVRELYEETSIRAATLLAEASQWYAYDLPLDVATQSWKGKYRGQTQKWFAFRYTGKDQDINIHSPGGGKHKAEFDDWKWVPVSALVDLVIPFKKPVYEKVVAEFAAFGR